MNYIDDLQKINEKIKNSRKSANRLQYKKLVQQSIQLRKNAEQSMTEWVMSVQNKSNAGFYL